jgi:hypothetical protein
LPLFTEFFELFVFFFLESESLLLFG